MPCSFLPPVLQGSSASKAGIILIGDAWNLRHPLTGGGMTVALSDVVLLCSLLEGVDNWSNWSRIQRLLNSWHWQRKPLASAINILSVALYDLWSADSSYQVSLSRNVGHWLSFHRWILSHTQNRMLEVFRTRGWTHQRSHFPSFRYFSFPHAPCIPFLFRCSLFYLGDVHTSPARVLAKWKTRLCSRDNGSIPLFDDQKRSRGMFCAFLNHLNIDSFHRFGPHVSSFVLLCGQKSVGGHQMILEGKEKFYSRLCSFSALWLPFLLWRYSRWLIELSLDRLSGWNVVKSLSP